MTARPRSARGGHRPLEGAPADVRRRPSRRLTALIALTIGTWLVATPQPTTAQADTDPFPGTALGQRIPGSPEQTWNVGEWEATNGYGTSPPSTITCPAGSGSAGTYDTRGSSDRFQHVGSRYCIKTWEPPIVEDQRRIDDEGRAAAEETARAAAQAAADADPGVQHCVTWRYDDLYGPGTAEGVVCTTTPLVTDTIVVTTTTTVAPGAPRDGTDGTWRIYEPGLVPGDCGLVSTVVTRTTSYQRPFTQAECDQRERDAAAQRARSQALAAAQAQAQSQPGRQICVAWSVGGESGQECAIVPLSTPPGSGTSTTSASTTTTTTPSPTSSATTSTSTAPTTTTTPVTSTTTTVLTTPTTTPTTTSVSPPAPTTSASNPPSPVTDSSPSTTSALATGEAVDQTTASAPLAPTAQPGQIAMRVAGSEVAPIVNVDGNRVEVEAGATKVSLTSPETSSQSLRSGSEIELSSNGLAPSSTVEVWLMSTPRLLGRFDVDSDGGFATRLALPRDVEAGDHRVVMAGTDRDGRELTLAIGVRIVATEASTSTVPVLVVVLVGLVAVMGLAAIRHRIRRLRSDAAPG